MKKFTLTLVVALVAFASVLVLNQAEAMPRHKNLLKISYFFAKDFGDTPGMQTLVEGSDVDLKHISKGLFHGRCQPYGQIALVCEKQSLPGKVEWSGFKTISKNKDIIILEVTPSTDHYIRFIPGGHKKPNLVIRIFEDV